MNSKGIPPFVRKFVIIFGFGSGFWISVGTDPETEIVKAFALWADSMESGLGILFWIIPIIVIVVSTWNAYETGGRLGLVAVFIAFIGGLLFVCCLPFSITLGAVGVILGLIATRPDTHKISQDG
jgi:hypothetical protein